MRRRDGVVSDEVGYMAPDSQGRAAAVVPESTTEGYGPAELRAGWPAGAPPRALHLPAHLLMGERERRLYLFRPESIEYIEADGNYVRFHVGHSDYISRDSVKRLAALLATRGFFRIERAVLLNVRAVAYVQRAGRGTYAFTMISGRCLHSSAKYRVDILRVLPLAQKPPSG